MLQLGPEARIHRPWRLQEAQAQRACRVPASQAHCIQTMQFPPRVNLTPATQPGPETSVAVTTRGKAGTGAKPSYWAQGSPHSRDLLAPECSQDQW